MDPSFKTNIMKDVAGFMAPEDPLDALHLMKLGYQSFGRPLLERYVNGILASVNDSSCANAMAELVTSFRGEHHDTVGLRMVEASGLAPQGLLGGNPTLLGDYDECLDTRATSFSGQYCLVTACLSPDQRPCGSLVFASVVAPALQFFSKAGGERSLAAAAAAVERLPLRVGVCVPSVCGADDVRALAQSALRPLHAGLRVDLDPVACRVAGDDSFGAADYCVMGFLMIMVSWCFIATIYEYITRGRRRNEWVAAFSALVNGAALLRPEGTGGGGIGGTDGNKGGGGTDGNKGGGGDGEGRDSLPPLHALRVIGFLGVCIGHCFLMYTDFPSVNLESAYKLSKELFAIIIAVTPFSVDIFLVLGGLLVAYILFNHMAQGGEFQFGPFYLYRYVRLTPALAVLMLLQTTVIMKINDGPLWRMQRAQECPKTWWYIMLHICNYFRPQGVTCLGHLWYLSLDWHLYILSPVVILAMRRRPRRTLITLAVIVAVAVFARFVEAYSYSLRFPWTPNGQEESQVKLNFPTHVRFPAYLMGIVLGFALHHLKRSSPLVLTQTQIAVTWTTLVATSIFLAYEAWLFVDPDRPYERLHESLFLAVAHEVTALVTAVGVFMIMAGHGGFLAWIACHRWWRPLSRLTYCMYLVHYPVLQCIVWNWRTPIAFSMWSVIKMTFMVWFLSIPIAFILAVVCECPIVQIARLLFVRHMKLKAKAKAAKNQKNGRHVIVRHSDLHDKIFNNQVKTS